MKVKYTGPDKDVVVRQLRFAKNKICIVEDESLARKLKNLPYFDVIDDEKAKAEEPVPAPGKMEVAGPVSTDAEVKDAPGDEDSK